MSKASLLLAVLAAPAFAGPTAPTLEERFAGKDGCFVLYDLKSRKKVESFGVERCAKRLPACSTFKLPLAVMAYDKGLLVDEDTPMKWDGKDRGIPAWNKDQTATSWMRNSVVWFSQRLTMALGMDTVKSYLDKFAYGDRDMSGGLTTAWLDMGGTASLKISADEQVAFLAKLWRDELPVSKDAMKKARKLTYLSTSPKGAVLQGKTGSSAPTETRLGWFVGRVFVPGQTPRDLVFALNFTEPTPKDGPRMGGPAAKELAVSILTDLGFY